MHAVRRPRNLLIIPIFRRMAKLIFGCGYLGTHVAAQWRAAGEAVYAVTRTADRAAALAALGIEPLIADIGQISPPALPKNVETVLFAVGYDRIGPTTMHAVYVGGLERALGALPPSVERFIYISTTGVYGPAGGDAVDEDTPCQPMREGGRASLAAEHLLRSSPWAARAIVLRLAGIYGPRRLPRAADLLAGRPLDTDPDALINLIHVEDAARIVIAAERAVQPPRLYVVSDGKPVLRREFYGEMARLLGAPPPRFALGDRSQATQRREGSKRVCPRRLFADLEPTLLYPSYREGLRAILESEATNTGITRAT